MPLAREVARDLAVEHGACIRPIQLRRTSLDTGEVDTLLVRCSRGTRRDGPRSAACERRGLHFPVPQRLCGVCMGDNSGRQTAPEVGLREDTPGRPWQVAETARCHAPRASADQHTDPGRIHGLLASRGGYPTQLCAADLATYETLTRLYVLPGLGAKRLDKLTLRDVRSWLSKLRDTCQCCAQGKDARRAEKQRRCCAKVPPMCCRRPAPSVASTHTRRLAPRHPGARHHLGLPLQRDRALPCPDPPRTRLLPNLVTDGFGQDRLCVYMNHAASPGRLPCGHRQP
jgi:hypothetical protein